MKKWICMLLALMICMPCALAQSIDDSFTLWFEEGFALDFPEGWVSYPVDEQTREGDIRYILSDGNAQRYMYLLYRSTTCETMSQLEAAIAADESYEKTGDLVFDGQSFIAFALAGQDVSGCMTLHNGHLLAFLYSPQSDSEYMMLAAAIMDTYQSIE